MERRRIRRADLLRLAREGVLTTADVGRILRLPPKNARKAAFDLRKRGLLTRVARGEYAVVPLDVEPSGFRPDPFLAVQKALHGQYAFSHLSALALFGGQDALRRTVHVSAPGARSRRRTLGDLIIHIHRAAPERWSETTSWVRRGRVSLPVRTTEQTLLDLAALPSRRQDYAADLEAFAVLLPRCEPGALRNLVVATPRQGIRVRVGHLLGRCVARDPKHARFRPVLDAIERSVSKPGPSYLGTRPRESGNHLDRRFGIVYPGGV